MIELERHIEILLLSNDCVIVPRLGDEVEELKQHLQNEGSYELNDIGVLTLNDDGNYVFTPCEAGILTPALYGLSSFEMKPLQTTAAHVVKAVPPVTEQPVETPQQPAAQIFDLGDQTPEEEVENTEEDDDVVRIKFSWIRNAVAVAAILLAVFFLAMPTGKTDMMQRTISNINNGLLFGMMSEDTNMSKIEIQKKVTRKETSRSENTQKTDSIAKSVADAQAKSVADAQAESVADAPRKYCIVLASCVSVRNANSFIERLQEKGYEQAEVFERNNIRRVIYGHYPSEEAAHDDLRRFHRHSETAEAWLMEL